MKTLNFDVSPDLHRQIKAEASRLGIPAAGFLRLLAVNYFEKRLGEADEYRAESSDPQRTEDQEADR